MSAALLLIHTSSLALLGVALAALLARRPDGAPRGGWYVLALAPGFAFVVNGCATWVRLYTGAFGVGAQTIACVALAAGALAFCARRRAFPREWRARGGRASPIVRRLLAVGVVLCAAIWVCFVANEPEGPADAWQDWNLKARFLWSAGDGWRALFTGGIAVANPSYPLLLPLNTASFFAVLGDDTCLVPIAIAACFTVALAGLLWAACAELGGGARVATCLLVLTPCFAPYAARQYADVEVAYFFLAATAALFTGLREGRGADFFLAGLWAGAAAFTKNEGIAFLAGLAAVALACTFGAAVRERRVRPLRGLLACAAGMAAVGWALWLFKARVAPLALAVEATPVLHLTLPSDWASRAGLTCAWSAWALVKPSMWAFLPVALVAAWWSGRAPRVRRASGAAWACAPLVGVLVVYFGVVLTSPEDAEWLVTGSVGRVLFQVWPGFLFLATTTTIAPSGGAARKDGPAAEA
jgi:hypothetical protein